MHESNVAITGIGITTPLSNSPEGLFDALLDKRSALKEWDDLIEAGFSQTVAARIESITDTNEFDRGKTLSCIAAQLAVDNAGINLSSTGVFVGTCMGESSIFEAAASNTDINIFEGLGFQYASAIKKELKLEGPVRTFGCACASGNYAIGSAAQMIEAGMVNSIVAGGVEPFSKIAHLGFMRSRAMATDRCQPFSEGRDGMQLGEAAAFLMLEHKTSALRRKAKIYGYINSLGLSCDAYHPTAPLPDGSGMAIAMSNAIRQAHLSKGHIDWICAHGTGTKLSDLAESKAIQHVFSEKTPPVTSIKGAVGHSLGAASAVEAVVCIMALNHKQLPPTVGTNKIDPSIDLDLVCSPREAGSIQYAMNCAYGFGGINSALIIQRP